MDKNTKTYDDIIFDEEMAMAENPTTSDKERQRIKREVIILTPEEEIEDSDYEEGEDVDEESEQESDDENEGDEKDDAKKTHEKSLIQHIITGSLLTDGTKPYYRYFIAIAVMCFLSIFLTFMSLNANHELRRKEKYAILLHERSVVKDEVRYEASAKSVITRRLKEHNIELVDLSKNSRLIEK